MRKTIKIGIIITLLFITFLAVAGCDEAGMIKPVVPVDGGTEPVEPPTEPAEPVEPTEPTTNGDVKKPEKPTKPVEPTEPTEPVEPEPTEPVEPTEPEPAEPSEPVEPEPTPEPEPEPVTTVTLPPGYELPPELIPARPPTLSADEAALIEADKWVKQNHPDIDDATAPKLRTQAGHTADLISLLPYKEREEVYDLFVASIDLPSFAKAAQRMWEINTQLRILGGEANKTGSWNEYDTYKEKVSVERGFLGSKNLNTLADIYFEENPQDDPYRHEGISYYWIILEYYRLQLENPDLQNLYEKNNPAELLELFRQSCKKRYIFGLDNPLS